MAVDLQISHGEPTLMGMRLREGFHVAQYRGVYSVSRDFYLDQDRQVESAVIHELAISSSTHDTTISSSDLSSQRISPQANSVASSRNAMAENLNLQHALPVNNGMLGDADIRRAQLQIRNEVQSNNNTQPVSILRNEATKVVSRRAAGAAVTPASANQRISQTASWVNRVRSSSGVRNSRTTRSEGFSFAQQLQDRRSASVEPTIESMVKREIQEREPKQSVLERILGAREAEKSQSLVGMSA